ncbi:hypothetical protein [Microbacterium allomyrinae]|uniref:Uncharacterized protein n=1 Tax=Microbacterium allomyrinae TaxID=2830666 RepID=A0A9X1LS11_9MICO|nr:hypothetical protein [Microbacterium allomyrinae]MCC2030608.1 hypothetical protein [Microbacterium allomyrinae]
MAKVLDLDDYDAALRDLKRRIHDLETTSPVGYTSITRGALRVASEDGLIVQGSAFITGVLRTVGRIILEGLGILTVHGLIELFGNLLVKSGGYIKVDGGRIEAGDVRIEDGKVYVGTMVLDPSSNGGSVKFAGGPEVYATAGMLGLYSTGSGGWIEIDSSGARLNFGTRSVRVTSTGIQLSGIPTRTSASSNGAPVGCLWADTSNNVFRVV